MRVTVTGATGLIGPAIVRALLARGDEVTVLSRNPERAAAAFGDRVEAVAWEPEAGPAPAAALAGRDGVVHLAGEQVAQRWSADAKTRILRSRELGTRNLVAGMRSADPRPAALASASGVDYYGNHGDERLTEDEPPGSGFLPGVCVVWEREARKAAEADVRVAIVRTGVVLDAKGGALAKMLLPFRLGVGGPVAGGRQYMPWIHLDDLAGIYLRALGDSDWSGPFNAATPEPVTNRVFSKALGRALRRPAIMPVPGFAVRLLYGDMAEIVTGGKRAIPARTLAHGYEFRHTDLEATLKDVLQD